ncbi:hypothetical protein ACFL6G_04535 [candidate division KSB1 bacterium]
MRKTVLFILSLLLIVSFIHCAGTGGGVRNTFKEKVKNKVPTPTYIEVSRKIFNKFQFEVEIDMTTGGGDLYLETLWKNRGLMPGESDMNILNARIKIKTTARPMSSASFSDLNITQTNFCNVEFYAYNEAIFAGNPEWQPLEIHPELRKYLKRVFSDFDAEFQGINIR